MSTPLLPAFTATRRDNLDAMVNRILCADAIQLLGTLPDNSIDMVLCDLPYGVLNEAFEWDVVIPMKPLWEQMKRVVKPDSAIALTATEPFATMLRSAAMNLFRYDLVYPKTNKTRFLDANRMPLQAHEMVLIFGKKLPRYYPQMTQDKSFKPQHRRYKKRAGDVRYIRDRELIRKDTFDTGKRYPTTILPSFHDKERHDSTKSGKERHPTQKPAPLFEYLIKTYTQPNDIVLDMTCGSGTTAVACMRTGRRFICGDNSPEYVSLANRRLANSNPAEDTVFADGTRQLSLLKYLEAQTA